MRLPSPPRIVVVSREEKEAKLKSYITAALAALRDGTSMLRGEAFTLVARAPDSPVAQAVLGCAADIAAAGHTIRVVFFETEPMAEDVVQASLLDVSGIDVRMLSDSRFAAAHEQLLLGSAQVWIGDCMRRDPMKRDAFEMYHEADTVTAAHAAASFAKLWAKSAPLNRVIPASVAANAILAGQPTGDASDAAPRR